MKTQLSICPGCGLQHTLPERTFVMCHCGRVVHAGQKDAGYVWDWFVFAAVVVTIAVVVGLLLLA